MQREYSFPRHHQIGLRLNSLLADLLDLRLISPLADLLDLSDIVTI